MALKAGDQLELGSTLLAVKLVQVAASNAAAGSSADAGDGDEGADAPASRR